MIKFWFDKFKHDRASHRLRAVLPSQELVKMGYNSKIVNSINDLDKDDIVIFSKDSDISSMRLVKSKGITVGFDLCDNKFKEEPEKYFSYCKEVDFITVNTTAMLEEVQQETQRRGFLYIDPVERQITAPKINNSNPINLVWYGGSGSNKYVDWVSAIRMLKESKISYRLSICVNSSEKLRNKLVGNLKKNNLDDQINNIEHIEWSWDKQQQLIEESDAIFIPILAEDDRTIRRIRTKSMNRVADGIASGKFVIAGSIPSYEPLRNFCWLDNPIDGLRFLIQHPNEVEERIKKGQEWLLENATAKNAADQLLEIYKKVKETL